MRSDDLEEATIYAEQMLRDPSWWPSPLADQWRSLYPILFSAHDLEMAHNQPRNHFFEWLAAVHLFQSERSLALVEKYQYRGAHPEKHALYTAAFTDDERRDLEAIQKEFGNKQLPDLLVLRQPDWRPYFVEVKGHDPITGHQDKLSAEQTECFKAIRYQLEVRVVLLNVMLVDSGDLGTVPG